LRRTPLPRWPFFAQDELDAASEVLRSGRVNYWTGEQGRQFEDEFARSCGSMHAIAVMNGTVALEACLVALGIGPGDAVIVPARTFAGTATAVVQVGARPVFADIDRDSGNLDIAGLRAALDSTCRAVIVVHLGGWPADMPAILEWCRTHELAVIEDCAQAQGAAIAGRPVGTWADMAAFSFCQDKIMTTAGEGGMVVCNDDALWRTAWSYKDHGKGWSAVYERQHPPGFRWLHEQPGTNGRMTEVQAAIGRRQLTKVDGWIERRRAAASRLREACLRYSALRVPFPEDSSHHAAYRLYAYVEPRALAPGWSRDKIMQAIEAEGIPCGVGSCGEVYLEQAFAHARPTAPLPVARELAATSLCFLVHPTLLPDDVSDAVNAIHKVMQVASTTETLP